MELDPKYVDVIVRRWQTWSGEQAVLAGEDLTFEKQSEQRSVRLAPRD
jgi:DNA modification methylase